MFTSTTWYKKAQSATDELLARTLVQATLGAAGGSPGETYDVFSGSAVDDAVDGSSAVSYAIQWRNHAGSDGYAKTHYDGADTGAVHQMVVFGIV